MMKDQEIAYYPVSLNVNGKKCVVVGGGQVALRKASVLLEHGADVEVVSPDLCPELAELARNGLIGAIAREYRADDLNNAFIAIAATDDNGINRRVATAARERKVLVNVVDDAGISDFIAPSYLRRGEVTIAVSTGGKSPALARKIRSRLEEELGHEYAILPDLISEVRAELKQKKIDIDGDGWQEALDLDLLLGLLRKGERDKARVALLNSLRAKQK